MRLHEAFIKLTPRGKLIIAACLLVVGSALVWFVAAQNIIGWDFRNNLWGPAHLLLRGDSPYRIDLLFENSNSVWMPSIIGALFPLGWLPLETASNLWFVLNIVLFVVMVLLAFPRRETRLPVGWLVSGLIAIFLFPSLLSHLYQGQISIVIGVALLVVTRLIARKERLWLAGLLTALALAKPQLTPFALAGMAVYLWHDKRALLRFAAAALAWSVLLTLPLWVGYPGWTADFLADLARNPDWAQPSSLVLLRQVLNDVGTAVWLALAAAGFGFNLWAWRAWPPRTAVLWSLALTVLLTPYVWTWDFVLLVPLLTHIYFSAKTALARLVWLVGYGACWLLFFYVRTTTDNSDIHFWWYGWAVMGVMLAVLLVERQCSARRVRAGHKTAPH
jgi:hypothetical protein